MPIISSKASMSAQAYGLFGVTAVPYGPSGAYDALATVTVPSGGASSITFSAIPQTGYSHLEIRGILLPSAAAQGRIQFNGDTGTNYSIHSLYGNGSTAGAQGDLNDNAIFFSRGNSMSNSYPNAFIGNILDYANIYKNKTMKMLNGADNNGSGNIYFDSGGWYNQSGINSITIFPSSGSWNQYTQLSLFGIK